MTGKCLATCSITVWRLRVGPLHISVRVEAGRSCPVRRWIRYHVEPTVAREGWAQREKKSAALLSQYTLRREPEAQRVAHIRTQDTTIMYQ